MSAKSRRQRVLDVFSDLLTDFLYYDRKESESLRMGEIEEAIAAGEVTVDELVDELRSRLTKTEGGTR